MPSGFWPTNNPVWNGFLGKPFLTLTPLGPNDGGDFGADTPTTTTLGFQEAINALPAAGGTIYVNWNGAIPLDAVVTVNKPVHFIGNGKRLTVITPPSVVTGNGWYSYFTVTSDNVTLEKIGFNGAIGGVYPPGAQGAVTVLANHFLMQDCLVENFSVAGNGSCGITVNLNQAAGGSASLTDIAFRNSEFASNGYGVSGGAVIYFFVANATTNDSIVFTGCDFHNNLTGCISFASNPLGLTTSSFGITISGCVFKDNCQSASEPAGNFADVYCTGIADCAISGNSFVLTTDVGIGIGIACYFCTDVSITGNTMNGILMPSANGDPAIAIGNSTGGCNRVTITGNVIYGYGNAVDFDACDNAMIADNVFAYQYLVPIGMYGIHANVTISGNLFVDWNTSATVADPDTACGISIEGPFSQTAIVGNQFIDDRTPALASYGIYVNSGSTPTTLVADNNFSGMLSGPIGFKGGIATQAATTIYRGNLGYTPAPSTPALPGTGVAFPALQYDAVYIITTATGLTGLTLDGIAIPILVNSDVFVGANHALVPTYTGTPVFKILPI